MKKFWCKYCLKDTPHSLITVMRVGNTVKQTFWDRLLKRNKAYYWECIYCGEKLRRRKRK